MKNKIKFNEKYAEKIGLDLSDIAISKDEMVIKRLSYDTEESNLSEEDGFVYGKITTIDIDSDGDVVIPEGVDFKRFNKNPIILLNHSLNSPIGFAEEIKVDSSHISAKIRFGSTGEAQKVHQLAVDKVLRTFSIGFIAVNSVFKGTREFDSVISVLKNKFPEKFNEMTVKKIDRIVTNSILVECSIVTVPSNEHAVMLEVKSIKNTEVLPEVVKEGEIVNETKEITTDIECHQSQAPKTETENKKIKEPVYIKLVGKNSNITKISTIEDENRRKLNEMYLKHWGV